MAYRYPTHDDPLGQGYSDTTTDYRAAIDKLLAEVKALRRGWCEEADAKVARMREECDQRVAALQKYIALMRETHTDLLAEALSQAAKLGNELAKCRADLERAGR